jgi:geranylgeranyl diphosphate synthase type II
VLIGSCGSVDLQKLTRFAFYLGAAFQIRDDLLNLLGTDEGYGRELLDAVREGKRALMLIDLLGAASPSDRRWLERYLAKPVRERTADEVARIVDLMGVHGSVEFAVDYGHGMADAAHDALGVALAGVPPSTTFALKTGLAPYMLERTR